MDQSMWFQYIRTPDPPAAMQHPTPSASCTVSYVTFTPVSADFFFFNVLVCFWHQLLSFLCYYLDRGHSPKVSASGSWIQSGNGMVASLWRWFLQTFPSVLEYHCFLSPIFCSLVPITLQSKESLCSLVLKDGLYIQSPHFGLVAMLSRKKKKSRWRTQWWPRKPLKYLTVNNCHIYIV